MAGDPFRAFYEDHEVIRRRLRALEQSLDAAMNRDRADSAEQHLFQETVMFLRTAVFDHFHREEHALLPPLEATVGRFGTLVNVITYDHEEVRREVGKLVEAVAALAAKGDEAHVAELREVNRHGIFLIQYLGLHMAKEDSSLAEMAREALGDDGIREVARRLEEAG